MNLLRLWFAERAVALACVALLALAVPVACGADQTPDGLSINIMSARPHLAAGQNFSLTAIITNNTSGIVYLNERYVRLRIPMELEGPDADVNSFWYGIFPAANPPDEAGDRTIALDPINGRTAVWFFWKFRNVQNVGCSFWPLPNTLSCARFYLFFMPGSYQLTVTADYWTDLSRVGDATPARAVQVANLDVEAPLWVVMIGAAIGGMLTYFVLPRPRREYRTDASRSLRYWLIEVGAFLGPILLAEIITILWARLGSAVPLIRLSVADLWGGIAVGFVGNYFGLGIIDRMVKGKADAANASVASRSAPAVEK